MSNTTENICKNCMHFTETTNEKEQPVSVCFRPIFRITNDMNVFTPYVKNITPQGTCQYFKQKIR